MVKNMLIDEYIKKVENVISNDDKDFAESLFEEIIRVYSDEIKDLDSGTSYLSARFNMVLNLNIDKPKDKLITNVDYINDLKVILPKLLKHAEKIEMMQNTQVLNNPVINNTINDSSINISDSSISKSSIGNVSQENKGKGKTIAAIIATLAGIATIIGTIFAILHQLGKL